MSAQVKRKLDDASVSGREAGQETVEITPLGAGQEVGRSCFILRYLSKTIMFDCGIHPAHTGRQSLPLFDNDNVDMAAVDMALITHFHLDHCAAVPFLVGKTHFKGRVFMTHATKAIFFTMMKDYVRMSKGRPDRELFGQHELDLAMAKIEVINFHQTLDIDGVLITPYRAGHVLGAAMFMVEIQGMRCLYTGDYSRVPDRHMPSADLPEIPPHIVIVESTFGVSNHLPREDRERTFQSKVRQIVLRGGRCLLPVVALGRAQELLLILEDFWERHPELQAVPIYQTSGIASRSMSVYQSYIEMMNEDIRNVFKVRNPFDFKHISHVTGRVQFQDMGPCVVLATPSMLQTGLSRDLMEAWCEDPKNGVIIADFAVQGTLACELLRQPKEVMAQDGRNLKLRCSVDTVSFSAHADYSQTSGFLDKLRPPHVVLCHGGPDEMDRLRRALVKSAAAQSIPREVHTPAVGQPVQLAFVPRRSVRVVGALAEGAPKPGHRVQGVLVQRNKHETPCVVAPADLGLYTKVSCGCVLQRQLLKLRTSWSQCRLALEMMFEGIEGGQTLGAVDHVDSAPGRTRLLISEAVTVEFTPPLESRTDEGDFGELLLEWESSPMADCVADAVVATLLQSQSQPPALGAAEESRRQALIDGDATAVASAELLITAELMKAQFGSASVDTASSSIKIEVPGNCIDISLADGGKPRIVCESPDGPLQQRVETCLLRLHTAFERFGPSSADD